MSQLEQNPITAPDYEEIAADYDRRYSQGELPGIRSTIENFKQRVKPGAWLEVGCGTGQWLLDTPSSIEPVGLDGSRQMLSQAQVKIPGTALVQALAERIPFKDHSFQAVATIHAFHHFSRPDEFLGQAARLLSPGGGLLILGMNAFAPAIEWYIYEFFEGTQRRDQARFPDYEALSERLGSLGFERVERGLAQQVDDTLVGEEVLAQPFLRRRGCSQMALLSDEEYQRGLAKIKLTIQQEPDHEFRAFVPLEYLWAVRGSR